MFWLLFCDSRVKNRVFTLWHQLAAVIVELIVISSFLAQLALYSYIICCTIEVICRLSTRISVRILGAPKKRVYSTSDWLIIFFWLKNWPVLPKSQDFSKSFIRTSCDLARDLRCLLWIIWRYCWDLENFGWYGPFWFKIHCLWWQV